MFYSYNSRKTTTLVLITLLCAYQSAVSQPSTDRKDKLPALLTIINACETTDRERWRASLDFRLGDSIIARDVRIGERSQSIPIQSRESKPIHIHKHGSAQPIKSVQQEFMEDSSYTIVISGVLSERSSQLDAHVIVDSPESNQTIPSGRSKISAINAIKSYPIWLSIEADAPVPLAPGQPFEKQIPPGELDIKIWFPYKENERRPISSGLLAEAGTNHVLVIYGSSERADRPSIFRSSSVQNRRELDEIAVAPPLADNLEETQ